MPPSSDPHANPGKDGGAGSSGFEPAVIEHYRIESVVARGGGGTVCRATDTTLDRTVALKVIDDPEGAATLIEEARNTSRLSHPRIAQVYQAGVDEVSGLAFIAFEWVEGPTLRALLRGGELPMRRVLRLAQDITSAVAHAHEAGLVHGDLKADNVVVTGDPGRAKLLDFGLSVTEDSVGEGDLWGTPAYMAPELLDGGPRTPKSDLFALGVLLHELATGTLPFGGEDGDEHAVRARQVEPIPNAKAERPELPSEIAERVRTMLSLDPAERTCDAVELERVIRLRRRADEGRRVRLPPLVALMLVAALGWVFRAELGLTARTPAGGAGNGGGAVAAPLPTVAVGTWVGREGEETTSARAMRDLLALHLSGEDPGSALLVDPAAAPDSANVISGSVRVEGGAEGAGEWVASWADLDGEERVDRALGALPLARELAATIAGRSANTLASTLEVSEEAQLLFVEGVRRSAQGNWDGARVAFSDARELAGAFPEAAAWEAALWILEGRPAEALALLEPLGEIPSAPGRVLRSVLVVPVKDASVRWGAEHPLATIVDLALDLHDPEVSDAALLAALRGRDDGEAPRVRAPWWARERAAIAWRTGDIPAMTRALERYRLLLGEERPADLVRLEHARRVAIGPRDEAIAAFQDRLFEFALDDAAYWLKIPYLLQTERFAPAARAASSLEATSENALAATFALALADRLDEAVERSRTIVDRYDPSLAQRVRAALEMLRGDTAAATRALAAAEQRDPGRPEIAILRDAMEREPFADPAPFAGREGPEPAVDSPAGRLATPFSLLSASRRSRLAGSPEAASDSLAAIRFVDDDLTVFPWPEAIFLGRLERVVALIEGGDAVGARKEWAAFRKLWPEDRAPASRVSAYAAEVRAAVEAIDGEGSPREE